MSEPVHEESAQVSTSAASTMLGDSETQDTNRHDAVSFETPPSVFENLPVRPFKFPSTVAYLLDVKDMMRLRYSVRADWQIFGLASIALHSFNMGVRVSTGTRAG